jgi:hypothetical protein
MAGNKTSYTGRSMAEIRSAAVADIKRNYPSLIQDFSDGSVGMMLIDIMAGASEGLEFRLDRAFQETQRATAQQRASLLGQADTLGVRIPGKRPSVSYCEFKVTVPVAGDSYAADYAPVLAAGAQVMGGGRVFETRAQIDFASPYSADGVPNQVVLPKVDAQGFVVSYDLIKSEVVVAGQTRRLKLVLGSTIPAFLEVMLPEPDVLEVLRVVNLPGLASGSERDILASGEGNPFYEVSALAETQVFQDVPGVEPDERGTYPGDWLPVSRKFTSHYNAQGRLILTFGGGNGDSAALQNALENSGAVGLSTVMLPLLSSTALGEPPLPGSTLIIEYRVGGGSSSNLGPGVLTQMGQYDLRVGGNRPDFVQIVSRSLSVTNPIPALGGADEPTLEEIRHLTRITHASRGSAVTIPDYLAMVHQLPGRYGAPAKASVSLVDNIVMVSVMGLNENKQLTNQSTSLLKQNLSRYLSGVNCVNDSIFVQDGRLFHLAYEISLLVSGEVGDADLTIATSKVVADFHSPGNSRMGVPLPLYQLKEKLNNLVGVLNVENLRVFSRRGGSYSLNRPEVEFVSEETGELATTGSVLSTGTDGVYAVLDVRRDVSLTFLRVKS